MWCYIFASRDLLHSRYNFYSNVLKCTFLVWFFFFSLKALHIHNNHLTVVPEQLLQLRCLFVLVLAFNRFASLPPVVAQMTNVRYSEVENIIMAGNQIEKISSETLVEMKHVKRLDLRLNQLILPTTETMKFTILEHLSHLDIRDNQVVDLDIRVIRTLEYLNCERNAISSLHLNGTSLKYLFAASNCKIICEIMYIICYLGFIYGIR